MVRISDILKKKLQIGQPSQEQAKEEIPKEKEAVKSESAAMAPMQVSKAMAQKETPEEPKEEQMQLARAMKEMEPDVEAASSIYGNGIQLVGELINDITAKQPVVLTPIKELLDGITNFFVLKGRSLLTLFYNDYPPKEYLGAHILNVTLLTMALGLELKYNKSQLNELGLAAFLHDIGMTKIQEIALKVGLLAKEDYERIKEHPLYGIEIAKTIKDIPEAVVRAIGEQHERMDGNGYPKKLKNGEIHEYARIIATVDAYEALCHSRVYRNKFPSYEAIRELITSDKTSAFDPAILKSLIEYIGIYPICSYVELNTGEIGMVINADSNLPLRPVVNIIFDANRKRLATPKLINLAKHLNVFVKKPVSDKDL